MHKAGADPESEAITDNSNDSNGRKLRKIASKSKRTISPQKKLAGILSFVEERNHSKNLLSAFPGERSVSCNGLYFIDQDNEEVFTDFRCFAIEKRETRTMLQR